MEDTESTPPHHPTYSVHLSDIQIRDILRTVFEDVEISEIEQLQRGESFNNRIYLITSAINSVEKQFALKVSGQFFEGRKVENEVSCLLLLAQYCPEVPAPRVLAWSLDGRHVESNHSLETIQNGNMIYTRSSAISDETEQTRSWILLERLPGGKLVIDESNAPIQRYGALMIQLASYVHAWRTRLPKYQDFGNLRMRRLPSEDKTTSLFKLDVAGLILCDKLDQNCRISTKYDYFYQRIENALRTVKTNNSFSSKYRGEMHQIVKSQDLRQEIMNMLVSKVSIDQNAFFTHYDFAPRNLLIVPSAADESPRISGILDFEFAGFFPVEEEFTNDIIGNEGDWPLDLYQMCLDELERLGCHVPAIRDTPDTPQKQNRLLDQQQWQNTLLLTQMIEDIAPWRIAAGSYEGQELENKLLEAIDRVKIGAARLFGRG